MTIIDRSNQILFVGGVPEKQFIAERKAAALRGKIGESYNWLENQMPVISPEQAFIEGCLCPES